MIHEMASLGAMQVYFGRTVLAELAARERAMTHACTMIQHESRGMLGHYQQAAGPFRGWAELSQYTKDARSAAGYPENDPLLVTGQLREAIAISVGPLRAGEYEGAVGVASNTVGTGSRIDPVRNIGDVAEWIELGTRHMEPRSFLGIAAVRMAERIANFLGQQTFFGLVGNEGARHYLNF